MQTDAMPANQSRPNHSLKVHMWGGTHAAAFRQWHYVIRIVYQRDLEEHAKAVPGERLSRWSPFP